MVREDFSFESAQLRALNDLTKAVIAPALVLASLVSAANAQLGYYTIPCYAFCIFLGSYLQGFYRSFQLRREARRVAVGKEDPVGSIPV
jgi:hypothetical protein